MKRALPIALVVLIITFFLYWNSKNHLIGGQKDNHGCLIGAGYSWCQAKNKCLRVWEEPCSLETGITYINKEYAYTLDIPLYWQNLYQVKNIYSDPKKDLKIGVILTTNFDYVTAKKEAHYLFSISRITTKSWEELQKQELFKGQKIGEKEDFVYYAQTSTNNPFTGVDGQNYQKMLGEIDSVLSTFKTI